MLLALRSALGTEAVAAQWTFTPDITVIGTYSDNPTLAPSTRQGDFNAQVAPGVHITGQSARFSARLDYTANALFYARNSQEDTILNTLTAFGNLEAIENFFFVDVSSDIAQSFISPFAPRPADLTTITANRTETRTNSISPYVRGEFAGGYLYELRNRDIWTNASNEALGHARTRQWTGRIASPIPLFGWALEYDNTNITYGDFDHAADQDSSLFRGRVFYQPDARLQFFVSSGREKNNFVLQQERTSSIYGAGLALRPTGRTAVDLEWERRFFGSARLASLTHRTRLTAWSLAYSRSLDNLQQELLRLAPGNTAALLDAIFAASISDPAERRATVERFLRITGTPRFLASSLAFFTQQIFIEDRVEASLALLGRRNSVELTAFRGKSSRVTQNLGFMTPDVLALAERIKQHGFGASASHRLTPLTSLTVYAMKIYSRSEAPATLDTREDQLTFNATRSVSPRTDVFGGLSFFRFRPSSAARTDATSVFIGLYHRF